MTAEPIAGRDRCDHCGSDVVFLPRIWGGEISRGPFNPEMSPIEDVHPFMRYAYSRQRKGVIRLDESLPDDSPYLPRMVLTPHKCGRAYLQSQPDPGYQNNSLAWIKDGPPADYQVPERIYIGFRRGMGRK